MYMKKIFLFIIISLIIIQPISAFSLFDFIKNFEINKITGIATGGSEQELCEDVGGVCRITCLSSEHVDITKICEDPNPTYQGTGEVTSPYCCMPNEVCVENWQCTSWTTCTNNQQTRTCTDINNCGTTINKPLEIQSCISQPTQNTCEISGGECKLVCDSNEEIDYDLSLSCELAGQEITGAATQDYCCVDRTHCSDGTSTGECSGNFQYCDTNFQLINNCNLCGCPSNQECIDNVCEDEYTGGEESGDPEIINLSPIFIQIPPITSLVTSPITPIDLSIYAIDPEEDQLTFMFGDNSMVFSSGIISCTITNSILNCNPINQGAISIIVKASDGIDTTSKTISINIFDPSLTTTEPGVVGAIENTPPIANAGSNKLVYPNQYINLDASKSYDNENNIISYEWFKDDNKIGEGISFKIKFTEFGTNQIKLKVTDAGGLFSTSTITISTGEKKKCLETDTVYFPQDTICNKAWPSNEGVLIDINSPINSCDLIEVCSTQLDSIIEDAIDCCDSSGLVDTKKINACNFAIKNSQDSKKCQALYVIKSLGANAIYMKDYFEAEMCCYGVKELCSNPSNLYSSNPKPKTSKENVNLVCKNTPENNPKGSWVSDSQITLNNIALSDIHAGASFSSLGTGTCVDYSAVLTTSLRKLDFSQNDVFTVEASTHAYNLIRFPLDKKYTVVDVTGNNDGLRFGKVPSGYKYCENMKSCYNDVGEFICPDNEKIFGCKGIKPNIFRESKLVVGKATNIFDWIKKAVIAELNR